MTTATSHKPATDALAQPLTHPQLEQFRQHGWVNLGRIMDDPTLEAMRAEEARVRALPFVMLDGTIEPDGLTIFRSQLCNYSAAVREFVMRGPQIEQVRQLVGPNISLFFNQYVTKLPDDASAKLAVFPWHQDNGYTRVDPGTNITVWTALDDVDEANGCVWVMPDSHTKGVLPHAKKKDSWHMETVVEGDGIPARLPAGHAVAFSGLTLHRSKENKSKKPRRAFFMEYCDLSATFGDDRVPVIKNPNAWPIAGSLPWPQVGVPR